jgi:hypothetical protein
VQGTDAQEASPETGSVHLRVVVRNRNGSPVAGLNQNRFTVTLDGHPAVVRRVKSFSSGRVASSSISNTYLLFIVPPMTLGARNALLSAVLTRLDDAAIGHWSIAVLDPSGNFVPFTNDLEQVRATIHSVLARPDMPQYGTSWINAAHRAMYVLASLPGRHVVFFATDPLLSTTESFRQNPNLLRVGPFLVQNDALQAMAQVYSLETSHPFTSIPFGEASESAPLNMVQRSASSASVGAEQLYTVLGDGEAQGAAWAMSGEIANATGGREEDSVKETFHDIEEDGVGTYELSLDVDASDLDGAYHPVSANVIQAHVNVFAPTWVSTPVQRVQRPSKLEPRLKALLDGIDHSNDLPIHLRAWYFPDNPGSVATIVFAAQLDRKEKSSQGRSAVEFAARLSLEGREVKSWTGVLYGTQSETSTAVHAVQLPPDNYIFVMAGYEGAALKGGASYLRFQVNPSNPNAFLGISSLLLSTGCRSQQNTGERRNLFNPLQEGNCELIPSVNPVLREDQKLHMLLRLYRGMAPGSFPNHWTALLRISDSSGRILKEIPAGIKPSNIRGWEIASTFSPSQFELSTGLYHIAVVVSGPQKRQFTASEQFIVSD